MAYQSEAQLEKLLIKDLANRSFHEIEISDIEALELNFRKELSVFNQDKLCDTPLSDKEFERIMLDVNGKSVHQSAKILRDKLLLNRDDGTDIYLELFDQKDYMRNHFQVTSQVTVTGTYTNRYDVTVLANGLPIIQIELKRRGMDIKQAFNQIERYRKHSYQGLFRYVQMFVISNGVDTKYFANTDSKPMFSFAFFWTDNANNRITKLQEFAHDFLTPSHITKMISRYTIINDTDKNLMVMRPYQVYAVEALTKTALQTGSGGFIWHTTGSGKTLTSFKCSQILAKEPSIKKVIFVVDRTDLDTQTTKEFNKFEDDSIDSTTNTGVLAKQLEDVDRSLIVTTIQKLSNAVCNKKYTDILKKFANEKVIIIFDECHRSTFGEQLRDIQKCFTKLQIFGFTGTPRFLENKSQDGRTTADIFGKCLHTYLIKEAITDNNVLGFSIEYMKTFDGEINEFDKSMVHGIDTTEIYDNPERISLVANHIIASHNAKTRNRQYCAIFATSGVPNLIKYYDAFKEIDHNLNISAVFSYGANEESEGRDEHSRDALERIITDYNKIFGTKYSTDTFSSYNKDISKKVKIGQIDILIVVNMYLTGFDSKPLNTLYVDKNLEYHGLLQAFSRTNRVEHSTKPFGNIVCYRNLKKKTDEAIKLFSQTDNVDDVLLKDYQFYLDLFKDKAGELFKIAMTPEDVDKLQGEDAQKEFVVAFRDLNKVVQVLKTFIEFEFDEAITSLSHQEFEDYRSKYLLIYESLKKDGAYDKTSILVDIDFSIELMATDRINVSYIMNLIRNIDVEDKKQQKKDVEHIRKEIERSDSLELRRKVDLIRKFLDDVVPVATPVDNMDDLYDKFESEEKIEEIKVFSNKNELDSDFLQKEIATYEFTNIMDKESILNNINKPLLTKTKISTKIIAFIESIVEKYQ